MAFLGQSFKNSEAPPPTAREVIPPGDYLAQIVGSEMKATKAGTGQYLELIFAILAGQYTNQKIYTTLNLFNPNQIAMDIARRDLADICAAVGLGEVSESEALHWKPMTIAVVVDPPKGAYPAKSIIKAYKPAGGGAAPVQTAPQTAPQASYNGAAAQPAQQRPAGGAAPWKRAAASAA